jgi:predicted O-linked N-acetylglucosamine transferase (SPINDLY family)
MAHIDSKQTFTLATQHHQAGRLHEAETLYRQILATDPNHADALHLLGVLARQAGRPEVAVAMIRQSLRLRPNNPAAHNNLGNALKTQGHFDEAVESYRQAIALAPNLADAHNNLGNALLKLGQNEAAVASYRQSIRLGPPTPEAYNNLASALTTLQHFEQAISVAQQAVTLKPDLAEAHNNLANALKGDGKYEQAIDSYRHALRIKPDFADVHYNLGIALQKIGRIDDAIDSYRQATRLDPHYGEAWSDLGNALKETGRIDEAIAAYRDAIRAKPAYAVAHYNLGIALRDQLKFAEAIASHQQAIILNPDFADAHCELGNTLRDSNRNEDAITSYQHAIRLRPDFADAHYYLGTAFQALARYDEAIASYRKALGLKPDYDKVHSDLGNALWANNQLDEAIEAYREAIRLNPDLAIAHSNLGYALAGAGRLDEGIAECREAIRLKADYVKAHGGLVFTLLYHPSSTPKMLREELDRWNEAHAAPLEKFIQSHRNEPDPDRRMRIGYLSPDFRQHTLASNLTPLFRHHNRNQCELFFYANVRRPDRLTDEYRSYADQWRDIADMPDDKAADLIRADQIDILVDLALHTADNRLLVFAQKPAPVQVTFAGYPGSTGLQTIDYRLTDPFLDPPDLEDDCYSEQSIRLPHSFWCYDPLGAQLSPNALPAEMNGFVSFGSLNNFRKVNDQVIQLWAKVLAAIPNSRLMMLCPAGAHRTLVSKSFEQAGVPADRIEFVLPSPRSQYLQHYHRIDIGLDTLPYNGHTTSLDSYWMGVPVVTLAGQTVVGRAGVSQLTNLGLTELIASTPEEFVDIAAKLSADLPHLAHLRRSLRTRMEQSPLMDGAQYARDIESAYRRMWRTRCENQSRK